MASLNWFWIANIAIGVFLGFLAVAAFAEARSRIGLWLSRLWLAWRARLRRQGGISSKLAVVLAIAVVAFGLGAIVITNVGDWFNGAEPAIPIVTKAAELEKDRVKPKPGILERVQYGQVPPTRIRIGDAPSAAGKQRVADYCTAAPVGQLVQTGAQSLLEGLRLVPDSATERGTGPRILPDFQGKVRGKHVTLTSTLSDGTPWSADYKVRGRWTFASSGDSANVRSERFLSRVARGLLRCGAIGLGGAGLGALTDLQQPLSGAARGAAIGSGTCAALELAF